MRTCFVLHRGEAQLLFRKQAADESAPVYKVLSALVATIFCLALVAYGAETDSGQAAADKGSADRPLFAVDLDASGPLTTR